MNLHEKNIKVAGVRITEARKALLLLHGRGGTAEDIISIAQYMDIKDTHIMAPQAAGNSWYPYSFLSPVEKNEPFLQSALDLLDDIIADIISAGLLPGNIVLLGFSQGACLGLEFAGRNARKLRGIAAFTGGLIGNRLHRDNYKGDFEQTKIFIGNSDQDPHVPLLRSRESAALMESLNAEVTLKIYPGMGHTINSDELQWVNDNLLR
jgi:phospholipase/carboxylesterase